MEANVVTLELVPLATMRAKLATPFVLDGTPVGGRYIFEVGDRVMVLKRGRNVGERRIRDTSEDEVLELIVQGDRDLVEA
jgi:hypothetical protein